ncbi:hypothetical protein BDV96DRAFT_601574 [Lophiotrema nucula]|uniref:Uncharacterized protein n=1 Tax=Lophiotrema nucula TaxID=690887 RepID=A0A6A5Z339_9PLEO|nr:hypothetical protein BDV96DRAFT_601574 [Lophiotrema nucula]
MALPNVLLREFQTDAISGWIPGKLVQTYTQLETLAYGDGQCEGKALQFLWNCGAYFDESCVRAGKLHVFAHFERQGTPRIRYGTSSTASSTIIHTDASFTTQSTARTVAHDVGMPAASRRRPIPQSRQGLAPARKRRKVMDVSSSASESGESNFIMSGSDADENESNEIVDQPPHRFPPLPRSDTSEQHALDFQAYSASNAPNGQYGHKDHWAQISLKYRGQVAHARLIHGIYGTPSPIVCDRCAKYALKCRIYHPDVKSTQGMQVVCGECRLGGRKCTINGQPLGVHRRDDGTPTDKSKGFLQGALAVSTNNKTFNTGDNLEYCPVKECTRSKQGFNHVPNFLRHVRSAHPGVNPYPKKTDRHPYMDSLAYGEVEGSPELDQHRETHGRTTEVLDSEDVELKLEDDDDAIDAAVAYVAMSSAAASTAVEAAAAVVAQELNSPSFNESQYQHASRLGTTKCAPSTEIPAGLVSSSSPFEDSLPEINDTPDAEEERFESAEETPNTASGSNPTPNGEENYHCFVKYPDRQFEDVESGAE